MASFSEVARLVINFLSGAEEIGHQAVSLEKEEERVYLVSYGPYGPLPSFDPDCLIAIVHSCFVNLLVILFSAG